jgi:hypothetical protein
MSSIGVPSTKSIPDRFNLALCPDNNSIDINLAAVKPILFGLF